MHRSDDIFDWLTLKDLAALNLTCKQLQKLTADYFRRKYPMRFMKCVQEWDTKDVKFRSKDKSLPHFWTNIRSLVVMPDGTVLRFLQSQFNKRLVSISFYDGEIPDEPDAIAHLVENADIIEIQYSRLDAEFHDTLLKYCAQIKQLVIKYQFTECEIHGIEYQWMLNVYPTLHHFHWSLPELPQHLDTFLRQNPNIRSFHSGVYPTMCTIEFFERTGIRIDELHLKLMFELYEHELDEMALVRDHLQTLYARQQFRTVMLQFEFCSHLLDPEWSKLAYLNGAYVDFPHEPGATKALTLLVHLKLLILGINTRLSSAKANKLAKNLINLEEIYVQTGTMHAISPFIRNAVRLKKVYVYHLNVPNEFDTRAKGNYIESLNADRTQLDNACKTIVYLPDHAFVQVKWECSTLNHHLIEIKRAESHTTMHPFAATMIRRDLCEMYERF